MSDRYSTYYSAGEAFFYSPDVLEKGDILIVGEGYHPYRFIDNVVYTDDLITFYFETYDSVVGRCQDEYVIKKNSMYLMAIAYQVFYTLRKCDGITGEREAIGYYLNYGNAKDKLSDCRRNILFAETTYEIDKRKLTLTPDEIDHPPKGNEDIDNFIKEKLRKNWIYPVVER